MEGGREGEPGSNSYHLQAGVNSYVLHVSSEVEGGRDGGTEGRREGF